jgi:hypothetical protein
MVVVPLTKPANESQDTPCASRAKAINCVQMVAGGTLVAGGVLLLSGKRREGLLVAASGTALALLDQHEKLCSWWNALPGLIDNVQRVLGQVQGTVDELSIQREKLRHLVSRQAE